MTRKIGMHQVLSIEQLLSAGAITEAQAVEMGWTRPPPMRWWRRLRFEGAWWWCQHRPRLHFRPCQGREYDL